MATLDTSDAQLISVMKQTPALYDPRNPEFKFSSRKEEIWMETAEHLGISSCDLKRRWTCLRDRYTRELKQMKLSKESHDPSVFFERMDFLRKYIRARSERKSIVCKIETKERINEEKMQQVDFGHGHGHHHHSIRFQKVEVMEEGDEEQCEEQLNVLEIVNDEEEDEQVTEYETYEEYEQPESPTLHDHKSDCITEKKPRSEDTVLITNTSGRSSVLTDSATTVVQTPSPSQFQDGEDDFFCKSVSAYLKNLTRVNKIRAKVEIFQTLQKFVEIEELSKE